MSKTFKTTVLLILTGVFGYLCKYIFTVYLTHHLSLRLYGDFSIATRVLTMLSIITLLGTNGGSQLFLSFFLDKKDTDGARAYIGWNLRVVSVSFSLCLLVALFSILIMGTAHVAHIKHIASYHFSVYMLWVAPLSAMALLLSSFLLSIKRHFMSTFSQPLTTLLELFFIGVAATFFKLPLSEVSISILIALAFFILILLELAMLKINAPDLFHKKTLHALFKKREYDKQWLSSSLKMILSKILFFLICTIDLIVVRIFSPAQNDTAFYAVALMIASFIFVISGNGYTHIKPRVNFLLETPEGKSKLQSLFNHSNMIVMGSVFLCVIFMIVFSKTLLSHFGQNYSEAQNVLIILLISNAICSMSRPGSVVLTYSGKIQELLWVNVLELGMILVIIIPLTHFFGMIGAACANFIVSFFQTARTAILSNRAGIKSLVVF